MDIIAEHVAPSLLPHHGSTWEVLGAAARLELTSFGGPIAYLGYFHAEYLVRVFGGGHVVLPLL
jgi:hypothetical protein